MPSSAPWRGRRPPRRSTVTDGLLRPPTRRGPVSSRGYSASPELRQLSGHVSVFGDWSEDGRAFEVDVRESAKVCMARKGLVPALEEAEDHDSCHGARAGGEAVDELALEGGEEALLEGVVVAGVGRAQRGTNAHLRASLVPRVRGVWRGVRADSGFSSFAAAALLVTSPCFSMSWSRNRSTTAAPIMIGDPRCLKTLVTSALVISLFAAWTPQDRR